MITAKTTAMAKKTNEPIHNNEKNPVCAVKYAAGMRNPINPAANIPKIIPKNILNPNFKPSSAMDE